MDWIFKRMLTNPRLPEQDRRPAGWPAAMREEWGSDEGASEARGHREKHLVWLRKVRAAHDAFRPDFIVIWGDDQYENFREEIVPAYCINAFDVFEFARHRRMSGTSPRTRNFASRAIRTPRNTLPAA